MPRGPLAKKASQGLRQSCIDGYDDDDDDGDYDDACNVNNDDDDDELTFLDRRVDVL